MASRRVMSMGARAAVRGASSCASSSSSLSMAAGRARFPTAATAYSTPCHLASFSATAQWSSSSHLSSSSTSTAPSSASFSSSSAALCSPVVIAGGRRPHVPLSHLAAQIPRASLITPSSRSFSSSTTPSPQPSKKGSESVIAREWEYLKEHARARRWLPQERKEEKKPPMAPPRAPPPLPKGAPKDQEGWDFENTRSKRQREEDEEERLQAELAEQPEPEAQPGEHPLMTIEQKKTQWERRKEEWTERLRSTQGVRTVVRSTRELEQTGPLGRALGLVSDSLRDVKDEAREEFDTSQHPMVHKARDISDKAIGESETSVAIAELGEDFDTSTFLDYVEDVLIPKFIGAYLAGDHQSEKSLQQWTAGDAARALFKIKRVRESEGFPDPRILEVRHVELTKATLDRGVPTLDVSFICQQVNCKRKLPGGQGAIVEGGMNQVYNINYALKLQRNENPAHGELEYIVIGFYYNVVHRLVA